MSQASEHTGWQRIYRSLFRVFGPAQNGPPPYATDDELEAYRASMVPPVARTDVGPPPGYRYTHYTDAGGIEHRAVVRDTRP
ncbi:MAG: hypothetical protein NTZ03_14290 [Actinobacteria bacterium]|nr:hypothetical protein [Actinomycetota bacterium]